MLTRIMAGFGAYLVCGTVLIESIGREGSCLQWDKKPGFFVRAVCVAAWPVIAFEVWIRG